MTLKTADQQFDEIDIDLSEPKAEETPKATKKNAPATKAKPTKTKEKDNPNGSVTENRMVNHGKDGLSYEDLPLGENGVEVKADKPKRDIKADIASIVQQGEVEKQNKQKILQDQANQEGKLAEATRNAMKSIKLPEAPKEEAVEDFDDGVYRVTTPIGRYNYRIQHGWSIPSLDQDYLEFAKEENGMAKGYSNSQMKALQNKNKAEMSDRAKQMALNRDLQAWKALQKRYEQGGFNTLPGRQLDVNALAEARRKIAQDYVMNGGNVDDEGTPLGLFDNGDNQSGFKASDRLAKGYSNDEQLMDTYLGELASDLNAGQFGTQAWKGKWDAVLNKVQRILAQQGGVQADAEKQRIQYLYLPPEMQDKYQDALKNYMDTLKAIASAGGSDTLKNDVMAKIQQLEATIDGAVNGDNAQTKLASGMSALELRKAITASYTDLPTALKATEDAWKAFEENINKIAVVDPTVIAVQMKLARSLSRDLYENTVKEGGGIPTSKTWNDENLNLDDWNKNKAEYQKLQVPTYGNLANYSLKDTGSDINSNGLGQYGRYK